MCNNQRNTHIWSSIDEELFLKTCADRGHGDKYGLVNIMCLKKRPSLYLPKTEYSNKSKWFKRIKQRMNISYKQRNNIKRKKKKEQNTDSTELFCSWSF